MDKFTTACRTGCLAAKIAYLEEFGAAYNLNNVYLKSIPFSILSEYWKHLQPRGLNVNFNEGANIEDAITSYLFDKELKFIVLEGIQDIEISLKQYCAQYIYKYDTSISPLKRGTWINKDLVEFIDTGCDQHNPKRFNVYKYFPSKVDKALLRMDKSPNSDYDIIDKMSFGNIRSIYEISCDDMRNGIISEYSMESTYPQQFQSFLASMNFIRNKSAHFERLWNINIRDVPKIIKNQDNPLYSITTNDEKSKHKIYNALAWMAYALNGINLKDQWICRFLKLINKYKEHDYTKRMGFPSDWRTMGFWSA